jgi:23S rRNA (uracil1939-C5)-methyltransferase
MSFRVRIGEDDAPLSVSPGGFVQANAGVNQALVDEVVSLAPIYAGKTVLDLYCGAGNFTLPLARAAGDVLAIEGYPPAARDAAENAARLGYDHVRVLDRSVAGALEDLASTGHRPGFALLDPPREGAADAVEALAALGPEDILYVSCSPPTLVRDAKLLGAHGYRVKWTRMADMFPQTAHMESLTLLGRA